MANPTADEVIKQAQLFLKDKAGLKWEPTTLLAYVNTGIQLLYRAHPSAFFVTSVITSAPAAVGLSDEIAVLPRFSEPLSHYVAAKALMEDADDEYNRKLGQDHLNAFAAQSA